MDRFLAHCSRGSSAAQTPSDHHFQRRAGAPSAGLEECRYDPGTDAFYLNNDGTTSNPLGELDVFPGAAVRAIAAGASVNYTALAGHKEFAEDACDPTGLALGPATTLPSIVAKAPLATRCWSRSWTNSGRNLGVD
jgi:hypothetical protein